MLDSLTISEGRSSSGGGIHNLGDLTLENCIVTDNATTDGVDGESGSAVGDYGQSGGYAGAGGGIYSNGTLTIANTTVSGNNAGDGGGGRGGSQSIYGGNGGNGGRGGSGDFLIYSGDGGHAGVGGYGGGIYSYGVCTLTITNSTVSHNRAGSGGHGGESGGGVGYGPGGSGGNGGGGGIRRGATVTITSSTVSNNTSGDGGDGGGIYGVSTLMVTNSTISNNTAYYGGYDSDYKDSGSGGSGGGIYRSNAGVNLLSDLSSSGLSAGPNLIVSTTPMLAPPRLCHPCSVFPSSMPRGDTGSLTATDQRGWWRVVDGDADGSAIVDIGAVESLRGADFDGFDFSGYDLSNVHLSGASLLGADLSSNDLSTTTLDNAYYNLSTQFPLGFDVSASTMIGIFTQGE